MESRQDLEQRVAVLERKARIARRSAGAFALLAVLLVLGGWIQDGQQQGAEEELRTERLILVDPDSGAEGTVRMQGRNVVIDVPGGVSAMFTPDPSLVLREGFEEVLRLGSPSARPVHD